MYLTHAYIKGNHHAMKSTISYAVFAALSTLLAIGGWAADGPKLPHMKIGVLAEGFDSEGDEDGSKKTYSKTVNIDITK